MVMDTKFLNQVKRIAPVLAAVLLQQGAFAQEMVWQTLFDSGTEAQRKGEYLLAERQLSGALKDAESLGSKDRRINRSLKQLAEVEDELGHYHQAEAHLERLLLLDEKSDGLSRDEKE